MKLLWLLIAFLLIACEDSYTPLDYGYHYSSRTPMGIMYRVDGAGAELDPDLLDYYFASVMNCVGEPPFDPRDLLVISTTKDANPEIDARVEGWTWQPFLSKPAVMVMNLTRDPTQFGELYSHELVHVFARMDEHWHEAFNRCGWRVY